MASIVHYYRDLMDNRSDPRVKDWFMMSSPFPTLFICLFYGYFSTVLGPKLMENRKPFTLRKVLIYYNMFQTVLSAWIFYEYMVSGWANGYSLKCQPVDYSETPLAIRMAATCWLYYISKFTEFFDTIFFILRKKYSQVSTLHVIHHGIMPMSVWFGVKFAPGGHSSFFALLNVVVHIVMYFYYMVSAMGPEYQKYLWWKKYLTTFQIVQFIAIFVHQFQLLFRECDYPKSFTVWIALHGVLFLFLFSGFYKEQYIEAEKRKKLANSNSLASSDDNDKNAAFSQNGVTKSSVANGTYSRNHTGTACKDVYYSNGISNGFMTASDQQKAHIMENGKTK